MDRKSFLSSLGLGVAFVCTGGCLASCSKESASNGSGGGMPPLPPGGSFTVDLNSEITVIGASVVRNGVIVVRLDSGNATSSFTAVQVACTHQGTPVNFVPADRRFVCPNHGSQFTAAGAVLNGPASSDLKRYGIAVSGTTLTVSA